MSAKIIKPHDLEDKNLETPRLSVFLAGTIDGGKSEDWQSRFTQILDKQFQDVTIYNPRRDSGKGFQMSNESEMDYQINWELEHLEKAHMIVMNILPDSKSPISLLELGLFSNRDASLFVICPKEFYRYKNAEIVCKRYKIPFFTSEKEFWYKVFNIEV